MKQFLRILCTLLLACCSFSAFAQTNIYFDSAGTYNWVCPLGVTSITLQMWGGGGQGDFWISGGGGSFVQTTAIPVTPGNTYKVKVGNYANNIGVDYYTAMSVFSVTETDSVFAYGVVSFFHTGQGGAANTTGNYVAASYAGGNGANSFDGTYETPSGGAAAASSCGTGANGNYGGAPGTGVCGGGSGGNGQSVPPSEGKFPGGGGGSGNGVAAGAGGRIILTYTCNASAGTIGNGHTVAYPPELVPDKVTSVTDPVLANGATITWQQSTDNINFVTAKTANTTNTYRFDLDSLQTTTYYRRGNNACLTAGTFGNWSDAVQIKVFTYNNGNGGRNGEITGYVQTRNATAIFNRKVYVESLTPLKGRAVGFRDSTFTNQQGKFNVDSVFYGDKTNGDSATVRFKVYADTTGGHMYKPSIAEITLSFVHPANHDLENQPFRDTASFAVTGQVTQVCTGCLDNNDNVATITGALDSVVVYGLGQNHSTDQNEKDSSITGYRNAPATYGNYGLIFQFTDTYTITPKFKNHKFKPSESVLAVNMNVSNVNFTDTTTHVISGFFGAGCGDYIGKATLEFGDSLPVGIDGKARAPVFRKQVTTNAKGFYSIRLPARAYKVKLIKIVVSDKIDPSTTQTLVKSFIKKLAVDSIYRDISTHDTTLNLIYQRPPQMQVSGLIDSSIIQNCSAFKNFAIWQQEETRPVTFKVYQGPISRGCPMDKGNVYLTTDVSNRMGVYDKDTIPVVNGEGVINLLAALPNPLKNADGNYAKSFSAKYTDPAGRGVSTDTIKPALPVIVVTGVSIDTTAKTFLTVTPQIPLLVLHDPPGNQSFSTYAKSVSSEQAISFKVENALSTGGWIDVKLGLDVLLGVFVVTGNKFWANIKASLDIINTVNNTKESVIKTTTTNAFSTSEDPGYVGPDDDLFYGAAMNMKYSEGVEIDWDSLNCAFSQKPVLVFSPEGIKTSFVYTLAEIRDQQIPKLQQAAEAKPDSASFFNNQIKVWQQIVDNNASNKRTAAIDSNLSFSSGANFTSTTTGSATNTNTYEYTMEIDSKLATEVGFSIAGTGLSGGFDVGFKMTTGESSTTTNTVETTTSYTLKDNNTGGLFSVNVKKDPVYGTPMFETVAGESSCPHEEGTVALDNTVITAKAQTLTNVKSDSANFTLYLGNLSIDPKPRTYLLFLDASSNPNGAAVSINGFSDPTGIPIPIKHGENQQATVTVRRNSAGGVYNYDNLHFILSDPCFPPTVQQFLLFSHEYSDIYLSADFASPVSGVNLVSPVSKWVANTASDNIVPVTFNGYDISKLASIAFQYNVPGSSTWKTAFTEAKNKLGSSSTTADWNISAIADGSYNIRLQVKDKSGNIIYSPVVTGLIDRKAPALYGTPQPANAIYAAGTQISYSYTENIDNAGLNASMVKMRDLTAKKNILVDLSAFGNTMVVVPTTDITANAGHQFRVIANGVTDLYGNVKTRPDTLYFAAGASSFGTGADALNITSAKTSIYEDAAGALNVLFTRNSPVADATVVYYSLAGNAVYNKDYTVTYSAGQTSVTGIKGAQGAIVLPKGSSVATMHIKPVNDSVLTPDKMITITLSPGGGYSIGSNYKVTDTILDHNTVKPVITANKPTTLCAGDSVTLSTLNKINGVNVKSYSWSTGAKTQSITVKTSGSYTVKVTDKNGLVGYSDPTIVTFICGAPVNLAANVLSKSSAALKWDIASCAKKYVVQYRQLGRPAWLKDTVASNKDTLKSLKANITYEWQVASICQYPVIVISSYTAGTNFTTPASLTEISVTSTPDYTKARAGDGFSASIYPNPASTTANIEVRGTKGNYSVVVMNLQGGVLWKAEGLTGSYIKIPLSSFAQGVYMVTVTDNLHTGTLKLVKQ